MTPAPAADAPRPTPAEPPSLRRRAPVRLDVTLRTGQCPAMSRRRVHLRAGRTLVVRVVPPHAGAKVEIVAEAPVGVVMPVSRVEDGAVPSYHGEYTGRSALRLAPLPVTGRLHISLSDGQAHPVRVTIPVTVWPSFGTLLVWWLLATAAILGARWQEVIARGNSPLTDAVSRVRGDFVFALELLLLGALVLVPLRVVGWLTTLGDPGDGTS